MTGIGLRDIREFQLPRGLLRDVQIALQRSGSEQRECFVLLTGQRGKDDVLTIRSLYVPDQVAGTHERGLSIVVGGDELQRLNMIWSERHEQLVAQVHSHPTYPFHSPTDDRYPIVTLEGGLSVVVPLFGFCDLTDLRSCAVYRLTDGRWQLVVGRDVDRLVRLI